MTAYDSNWMTTRGPGGLWRPFVAWKPSVINAPRPNMYNRYDVYSDEARYGWRPAGPRCRRNALPRFGLSNALPGKAWLNLTVDWPAKARTSSSSATNTKTRQLEPVGHLRSLCGAMPNRSSGDTLRLRLIKIAAPVIEMKTMIRVNSRTASLGSRKGRAALLPRGQIDHRALLN
jgi:hypothetical protein